MEDDKTAEQAYQAALAPPDGAVMVEPPAASEPEANTNEPTAAELAAVVTLDEQQTAPDVDLDAVFRRIDQVRALEELPPGEPYDEAPEFGLKCFKDADGHQARNMLVVRIGDKFFKQEISHE